MENFSPISAFIGGALIGVSAVMLMWINGRIAGISGIFSGLLTVDREHIAWRLAFVAGLIVGPLFYPIFSGTAPAIELKGSVPLLIIAGLLVGIGTRIGGGCTSGHGVCGMARLSKRSIVATCVFMATAIVTVYAMGV